MSDQPDLPLDAPLAKVETKPLAVAADPIAALFTVENIAKIDVDKLERLIALKERMEGVEAKKAFAEAKAAFQKACPLIKKTSTASIVTKSGSRYSYNYAELSGIVATINDYLHPNGLTYSWDSSNAQGEISVTCKLSHVLGHSETATFSGSTESSSPGMSKIQQQAAALTFARRQSLIQVLGLTTCDADIDGADPAVTGDTIAEAQANDLNDLMIQANADQAKFLGSYGVQTSAELPAKNFKSAVKRLQTAIDKEAKG